MILPALEEHQTLIPYLKARIFLAVFHYQPLHLSDIGKRFGGKEGDCPVTEDISGRLLRLPLYNDLIEEYQTYVIAAIKEFYRENKSSIALLS